MVMDGQENAANKKDKKHKTFIAPKVIIQDSKNQGQSFSLLKIRYLSFWWPFDDSREVKDVFVGISNVLIFYYF